MSLESVSVFFLLLTLWKLTSFWYLYIYLGIFHDFILEKSIKFKKKSLEFCTLRKQLYLALNSKSI